MEASESDSIKPAEQPATKKKPFFGIQMKLAPKPSVSLAPNPFLNKPKPPTVAKAFGNDSDEESEEMPSECKMRMKNIGRFTPTSSGPNSYGKTREGFVNMSKIYEKQLKDLLKDD